MFSNIVNQRILTYGFLTWLVPFVLSFFFFGRDGNPVIPIAYFKSIMIVVGASIGAWLFVKVFQKTASGIGTGTGTGTAIGVLWLIINLGLDLVILVPMSKMGLPEYFFGTGLRYLIIPIMGAAFGAVSVIHKMPA